MENMEIIDLFKSIYKGKKVLVTGDTGFKGSWLCIWLREMGADVYGYSLPPISENDNYIKSGLAQLIHHKDGDIRNAEDLLSYFQEIKPEIAFHLAAQALVLESYQSPQETFNTNVMGTVNFFEAVRKTPSVKVVVNITSDKCYKNNEWIWGYRENDPMGGNDPYSASKGCSELVTHSYMMSFFKEENKCKIATARAGNVIGGGDWAENRIIPDFFKAFKDKKTLIVRNPYATRPWQHVLEPLGGYLLLGARLLSSAEDFRGNWNFGPLFANNITVKELIDQLLIHLPDAKIEIPGNPQPFHEASLLNLDISKAIHNLDWLPILSFEQTIDFTVKGYNELSLSENIYYSRVKQINEYISEGINKNISWFL